MTHSSRLLPVRCGATPAMLKVALAREEKAGGRLMAWWAEQGAARVLAYDGDAVLLERAEGGGALLEMALNGRDDEASRILCAVAARLHASRSGSPPPVVPLERWFADLYAVAACHGGILADCAAAARVLLADQREIAVLHGDLHHENVLDFGARGWRAIDPKGLIGERGFDHAGILCNPELATTAEPERFRRQVDIVAGAAGLNRRRLLQWVLAAAGLSAAWFLEDNDPAESDIAVARLAAAELAAY